MVTVMIRLLRIIENIDKLEKPQMIRLKEMFPLTAFMRRPWQFPSQRTTPDQDATSSCPAHQADAYELGDINSTSYPSPESTPPRSSIYSTLSMCSRRSTDTSTTVMRRSTLRDSRPDLCQSQLEPRPYDKFASSIFSIDLWGCSLHKMYC